MFGSFLSDAIVNYVIIINNVNYLITKSNASLENAISLYNNVDNTYLRHRFGVLRSDPLPSDYDQYFVYDSSFIPELNTNGIILKCSNPGFDGQVISFIDDRYLISSASPAVFHPFVMPHFGDTVEFVNRKFLLCQANNGNPEAFSIKSLLPGQSFLRHRFGRVYTEMSDTEDDSFFNDDSSFALIPSAFGEFRIKCTNKGFDDHYVVVNNNGDLLIKPQSEIGVSASSLSDTAGLLSDSTVEYRCATVRLLADKTAILSEQRLIQTSERIFEIERFCNETSRRISDLENKLDVCLSKNLELISRIRILENLEFLKLNQRFSRSSPLISIVIPVYNEEKYLSRCLNTVLSQTFSSFELIIVNDGSTDKTGEILSEYSLRDSRIFVINSDHKGAGEARNIGLANAKGEFICILDSDDEYDPRMLMTLYTQAAADNLDIMVCRSERMSGDDVESREKMPWTISEAYLPHHRVFSAGDCADYIFQIFNGWTWDKLFSAEFIRKSGLKFQNTAFSNDAMFTFTALCSAKRIGITAEYLVTHRYHDHSIEARRYEDPDNFVEVFRAIYAWLENTGNISRFGLSFYNWVVSFTRWQYETQRDEFRNAIVASASQFMTVFGIPDKLVRIYKDEDTLWLARNVALQVPEVSVIMPVYNSERYLEETIRSLISQTMNNFEVICIDDESQDKSFEILMNIAKTDKRFRIVRQDNRGAGAARNRGLDLARGRYLAFIDSDDTYSDTFLEKMLGKARRYDLDVLVCRYTRFFDQHNTEEHSAKGINMKLLPNKDVFSLPDIKDNFFQVFVPVVWNKLFKREFAERYGIRCQEIKNSNDTFFVYHALLSASAISIVDESLIRYRMRSNSLVRTRHQDPECYRIAQIALEKMVTEFGLLQDEGFSNSFKLRIKQNTEWNEKMIATSWKT